MNTTTNPAASKALSVLTSLQSAPVNCGLVEQRYEQGTATPSERATATLHLRLAELRAVEAGVIQEVAR